MRSRNNGFQNQVLLGVTGIDVSSQEKALISVKLYSLSFNIVHLDRIVKGLH